MTRSALTPVLAEASAAGRAVAAFNVIQLEHAEAYAAAAERVGLPVVMQISENCVRYHGSLAPLAADLDGIADLPTGRDDWAAVLRRGVAWSAAAVLQPVAGAVDPADVDRLLPTVEIEEIRP